MRNFLRINYRFYRQKSARFAGVNSTLFTVTTGLIAALLILAFPAQAQSPQEENQASAPGLLEDPIPFFWDPRAVQDRPKELPDKIQFAASDDFPPFVFRDSQGKLTGFNVDLARALCEALNASCALKILPFEDVARSVIDGESDAAIAGLAPSKTLNADLTFTQDYLKLPGRFVVRKDNAGRFRETDLAGARIAVVAGSRHERFARAFWPEAALLSLPSAGAARQMVQDGNALAHFGSGLSLALWLAGEASGDCCVFSGGPWLEAGYFDQGLSIAVRKSKPGLAEALNYALRKVAEKGVYRELYLRYFPIGFY